MKLIQNAIATAVITACSLNASANNETNTEETEVIVVTASLSEKNITTAPAFTSVIDAEQIMASPVTGLPEVIKQAVGVENFSDSSGRDELRMRGLAGGYTLVLINGKRISSSSALWRGGDFDLNAIPLSGIERIEIVRGSMSSLYGADAIGGVINIITKAPVDIWQGKIAADVKVVSEGEGGNQQRLAISTQGALSKHVHLAVAAEIQNRDAWFIEGEKAKVNSPKLEEKNVKNFYSTLRWALDDSQRIEFDLSVNHDDRPHDIYYAKGPFTDLREQNIERTTFGTTYAGQWDWGTAIVQAQYENAELLDFNTRYDEPKKRDLTENNLQIKAMVQLLAGDKNQITLGADYRDQTVKDTVSFITSGEQSIQDTAIFIQDEITINDKLILTIGGRLDNNEFFNEHFTSRAYLVYQVNDHLTLKGGFSEAFKAPRAYQLAEQYSIISCGGGCFLTGNPDLKPETSENYELGFVYSQTNWDVSAVYFKNNAEDMISALYDEALAKRIWSNIDKFSSKGIEIEASFRVSSDIDFNFNYTSVDTEDSSGQPLLDRPEATALAKVNWDIHELFSANVTYSYTGAQEGYVWPDVVKLPSFSRYDLGFVTELNEQFTFKYGIKNLGNVQLQEKDENFTTYELGRNYYFAVSYNF